MPSSMMLEHIAAVDNNDSILDFESRVDMFSPAMASGDDAFSSLFQADSHDEAADLMMSTFHGSPGSDTPFRDRVSEARSIVLRRLKSIQQILPYRSLELVEELILETWRLQDTGKADKFWMDVTIENGWQFLLV